MKQYVLVVVCLSAAAMRAPAQSVPGIRPLGPVVATAPSLRNVSEVRQLSDGRVLVNDAGARQVLLFDSTLTHPIVVLDSSGVASRRYSAGGSLIPFTGDSTLFVDRSARVFLVLDPAGVIAREMALPAGAGIPSDKAGLDHGGRLVYDLRSLRVVPNLLPGGARGPITTSITSLDLLAHNFATRSLDTVVRISLDTTVRVPPVAPGVDPAVREALALVVPTPPSFFPAQSDWALMSDGTVAVVRGQDYHIDWIDAQGKMTPSPKIAHEWKRLTDDDKVRMADSLTRMRDSTNKAQLAVAATMANARPIYDASMGRIIAVASVPARAGSPPAPLPPPPPAAFVPVPTIGIPDYLPPFATGVMADADNRLWIPLPVTMVPYPDRVYDIVDRNAKLIDRVRVGPPTIVGFGPGTAYLFVRDGGGGRLERVRVH